MPRVKPLYSRLLVDAEGRIWVQRYPRIWAGFERIFRHPFGDEANQWWVFAPDGRLLGTAATPGRLLIHDIGGGVAAGVSAGATGEEVVEVARLRLPDPR